MAISDTLREVKLSLEEIKRKYRFKKSRMKRENEIELQTTLAKCRGQLEICKKDFNRSINAQSRNINEGTKQGVDTIIQEQILWDAAIGYLLVKDAIFALETIGSYDAVSHAYEMLDAAMKQVSNKKDGFPLMKIGSTKERNAYGYITSSAALKEKEELLDSIFEDLKVKGDIEARLLEAPMPAARRAQQRHDYTKSSELDDIMRDMDALSDTSAVGGDLDRDMSSMLDIHPPKDI